jgi:uncharacterized membrane protein YphA (DoxX/SURF4 family)
MKAIVNTARILVGGLFVFSGLVKAIDPLGLSYKMKEFFEVWAADGYLPKLMNWMNSHSLAFSIFMITLEVIAGFMLLIGFKKNITTWLLLLLTLFFTFLTAFVLFTGKIRACGCFGDCIPLTPIQTFTKDIILTVLIILILIGRKYIQPLFKTSIAAIATAGVLAIVLFLQYYVLHHLPLKDCLPFKPGNNILELRKMPKDAIPDKYDYLFIYSKNGEKKEFDMRSLPDSSWTYVDRKQILVQKGSNNVPLINDFSLTATQMETVVGDSSTQVAYQQETTKDVTEDVLNQPGQYYLLFIKEAGDSSNWLPILKTVYSKLKDKSKLQIIASQNKEVDNVVNKSAAPMNIRVLSCDATALKTAARNDVTLYEMNGPVVQHKWGGNDVSGAIH